jgi:hypothetical protein
VGEENQDNDNTQQLKAPIKQNNEEVEERALKFEFRVVRCCLLSICSLERIQRDTERRAKEKHQTIKEDKNPQK